MKSLAAKSFFKRCRCDEGFEQILVDSTEVAKNRKFFHRLNNNQSEEKKENAMPQKDEIEKEASIDAKQDFEWIFTLLF